MSVGRYGAGRTSASSGGAAGSSRTSPSTSPLPTPPFVRSPHALCRSDAGRDRASRLDAGGARGAHRRGLDRCRATARPEGVWPVKDMSGADLAHRLPAAHLRRRRGSLRGRESSSWWSPRTATRPSMPPRSSRSITRRSRPTRSRPGALDPDTPLVHPAFGTNEVMVTEHGLKEGDRGGARERPSRDRGSWCPPPRHRRLDGAPRLPGPLRPGQRSLHGVDHQPGPAHRAPLLHQVAAHSRAQAARDRAGCRRRFG